MQSVDTSLRYLASVWVPSPLAKRSTELHRHFRRAGIMAGDELGAIFLRKATHYARLHVTKGREYPLWLQYHAESRLGQR